MSVEKIPSQACRGAGSMTIPSVCIGLRSGRVFIISTYSPGPGTYVHKEPVICANSFDSEAIGDAVLFGLSEFVHNGPMPDWDTYKSPVLNAAGVGQNTKPGCALVSWIGTKAVIVREETTSLLRCFQLRTRPRLEKPFFLPLAHR
jgi:hypothetical protein